MAISNTPKAGSSNTRSHSSTPRGRACSAASGPPEEVYGRIGDRTHNRIVSSHHRDSSPLGGDSDDDLDLRNNACDSSPSRNSPHLTIAHTMQMEQPSSPPPSDDIHQFLEDRSHQLPQSPPEAPSQTQQQNFGPQKNIKNTRGSLQIATLNIRSGGSTTIRASIREKQGQRKRKHVSSSLPGDADSDKENLPAKRARGKTVLERVFKEHQMEDERLLSEARQH
ncbi:hypothetical protein M422DRAFT_263424 [Sphaerobolus stellatus SS14]|uniref:Uncharacterized protein n=1 Tax=Sphaerobolus stellatus (strain SS14) TaxID=990650 RepID=A0A0C9VB10_SPHS4|nr:hypothetical protein M422DRAFT_263424 [Sphaerobolus stellatus SS14]